MHPINWATNCINQNNSIVVSLLSTSEWMNNQKVDAMPFADISYTDIAWDIHENGAFHVWCSLCTSLYRNGDSWNILWNIVNKKSLLTNQHKKNMKNSDQPKAVSFLYEGKAAFSRGAPRTACKRTVTQFLITTCLANFRNSESFVLLFDWILLRRIDSTLFANMSIAKQQPAHPNRRTRNVQSPCVTKAESAAKYLATLG